MKTEWISREERLPELRELVMMYRPGMGVSLGRRLAIGRNNNNRWFWQNTSIKAETVSHWMPLPEPPEKSEK